MTIELSIVIPTRNEADCVRPLLEQLSPVLRNHSAEVIFVDDSDDRTPATILESDNSFDFEIRLIQRPPGARHDGLGGAVLTGIRASRGSRIGVMDADLQHPPELIPDLLSMLEAADADLVVAERKLAGDRPLGLSPARARFSRGLNDLLRALFRKQLGRVRDPLSGMFVFRRDRIDPGRLAPRGYKILLDILIRHPDLKVANLPFEFQPRHAGVSKAGWREGLRFLGLLVRLWPVYNRSLLQFLTVGLTGLLVNSALLALFVESGRLHYLLGAVLATQGSTFWNFALTDRWVFPDGQKQRPGLQRLAVFFLVNNLLLLFRAPLFGLFVDGIGINYLAANVLSIGLLALARFTLSDRWIWASRRADKAASPVYYDVHGLVRIASSVPLPELVAFRTAERPDAVDLQVETCPKRTLQPDPEAVTYDEGLGDAGFWLRIRIGDPARIFASPLLARSPHVLYTNVVEPVLRWILVRKGHALVHGACLSHRGAGLLISARTDTGKTTTILKSLGVYPFDYLSDDMVILGADGRLRSYPKPLTISRHTLQAVPMADLNLLERIRLQVQSRIHSRLGRRIGIFFGNIRLPAATLNAYLQMLVPPPKYGIERLVPGAKQVESTVLNHLVVIERGPVHERILPKDQVYPVLARNIEDAYGFPPYPQLAAALSCWDGRDLHAVEADLIARIVDRLPAVVIRREDYDWWQRIPAIFYGDLFGVSNPISSRYPTVPRDAVVHPGG